MSHEYALGIDLGTTNSCVAIVEHGKAMIIPNKAGYTTTPSIVAISEAGKRLIGQLAKRQSITNAANTAYSTKRLIGRSIHDPETQHCQDLMPYEIVEGPHGDVRIVLRGQTFSLQEIAAMILCELRAVAEAYVDAPINKAILTVPAYFDDAQRQATIDAGKIAGLDVMRIINEPTAAAIAYSTKVSQRQTIAVYDLGGGTFDISILSIDDGVFDVLSSTGDSFLGGEDFDNRIIEHLVLDFARQHGVDLRQDVMAIQRLKIAAEKCKCDLSELQRSEINLPFIHALPSGEALHLNTELTREKFESLTVDLVKRTLKIAQVAMNQANVTTADIDEVVLVGGMTRMPLIQMVVSKLFQTPVAKNIHPDEAVAIGAAIQGDSLLHPENQHILLDVSPFDLGIAVKGGGFHVITPKNTTIPSSNSTIFTTSSDNQTTLRIVVLQGDASESSDRQVLAEFTFLGIEPAPAGSVDIELCFDIDVDGIVNVTAKDLATQRQHIVSITRSSKLSPEEINDMMRANADYLLAEKQENRAYESLEYLKKRTRLLELNCQASDAKLPPIILKHAAELLAKAQHIGRDATVEELERLAQDIDNTLQLLANAQSSEA